MIDTKIFLFISKKNKEFISVRQNKLEVPFLYLTNSFLASLEGKKVEVLSEGIKTWSSNIFNDLEVSKLLPEEKPGEETKQDFAKVLVKIAVNAPIKNMVGGLTEKPVCLSGFALEEDIVFWLEYLLVFWTIHSWLIPQGKGRAGTKGRETPSQRYAKTYGTMLLFPNLLDALPLLVRIPDLLQVSTKGKMNVDLWHFCAQRCKQFSTQPTSIEIEATSRKADTKDGTLKTVLEKRIFAEQYASNSLLPLVWAELLYCVKNDIFVQFCQVCGRLFPVWKNLKGIYCSRKCYSEGKRRKETARRKSFR
jgi:hypothetical protein